MLDRILGRILGTLGLLGRWRRREVPGRRGEDVAARHLSRQGLRVIARNVRQGRAEIDIVAVDGTTLVFVEVKSRTGAERRDLTGLERIDSRKKAALRRACSLYRKKAGCRVESWRLDVVTVDFEEGSGEGRVRALHWYPSFLDLDERC